MGGKSTLRLSGSVKIKDNKSNNTDSNVYLPDGMTIEITGNLTGSASSVGVTLQTLPSEGQYVSFAKAASGVILTNADKNVFFIDDTDSDNYRLTYGSSEVLIINGVQYTLAPGGRYYFDLSAMDIPGTVNSNLSDKTLHYVPFTYVGTVDAYVLNTASVGVADSSEKASVATDKDAQYGYVYEHSLFIVDDKVTTNISWIDLNNAGFIFGKSYTAGGINYTLSAPTIGNQNDFDDYKCGLPINNEWEQIIAKNPDFLRLPENTECYTWGQDTYYDQDNSAGANCYRSFRMNYNQLWGGSESSTVGAYRPVLELPTDLAADSLKIVKVRTGENMPGETEDYINIIVKNGSTFTAPAAEGLSRPDGVSADAPLWWKDENGNYYKPGDTVPAEVSELSALWSGFGLFLDRGDGKGAIEVTPDNYTDIFGDGSASFIVPQGNKVYDAEWLNSLTPSEAYKLFTTGKESDGSTLPSLKLKDADIAAVTFGDRYIGQSMPFFITTDGKNTIGNFNNYVSMLSVLGDGDLTVNGPLSTFIYTQYGGSVTMKNALGACCLYMYKGSLTVTGDTQALHMSDSVYSFYPLGVRIFTGSSAQDAEETVEWQFSPEIQELYRRYVAGETLTAEEYKAIDSAFDKQCEAMMALLSGKAYVRIANAWDVTYQSGTNGKGDAVTDIKFYNDVLTLRGKLFTRTGYTQTGWATIDGGEKVYGLEDIYTANEALTLYPVWNTNKYTITFDTAGGSKIDSITQDYDTAITAPADPTREGYTFIGWNKAIPATMPAENVTITAQWKINQYTITFDTTGGSEIAPITQDYGTEITAPANPTREGYTFIGWDKAIPATMPAENVTITAQWKINQYTIKFDTAGGSEIASITHDYGTEITAPANPTREGYTFVGWDKEIPATMPAENITITAQWKDAEKPTGEISVGTSKWKTFLNNITFGLFFNETQTVTVTASDNSGDDVKIEYLLLAKELTEAELANAAFTVYTAPFDIDPDNEYIVYVRMTDIAGNTDYICSDGIVLDGTNPVVDGIENDKIYCEAQTVMVIEKYVDTVTVNGNSVTLDENNQFVLSPKSGTQKIVVTDKAGNVTAVTATVNNGHTASEDDGDCTTPVKCMYHDDVIVIPAKQHDFSGDWHKDENAHWHNCQNSGCTISGAKTAHSGNDDDDCTTAVVCECGYVLTAAKTEHIWGVWVSDGNGKHTHKCTVDGCTVSETNDCSGGTATCHTKAVCDVCHDEYGEYDENNHDGGTKVSGDIKASCTQKGYTGDTYCLGCKKVLTKGTEIAANGHSGGTATCRDKAKCDVCGMNYGELNPKNHANLKHIDAKAATKDVEGNIEYWYCDGCDKYFSDVAATKEISRADTVTKKLQDYPKSPQTGDYTNLIPLWFVLLFVGGGAAIGATVIIKRRRYNR